MIEQLMKAIPELANPNTKRIIVEQMIQFAMNNGYTQQEIMNIVNNQDIKAIMMIYKAMKYDQGTRV